MMKLFDFECGMCGHIVERVVKNNETVSCPRCLRKMDRLPPIVSIHMGVGPYGRYDETLGKYVSTNREWRDECQKQNVSPKGDTPKPNGNAWI